MIIGTHEKRRRIRLASVDTLIRLAEQGKHGRHWYAYAADQIDRAAWHLGVDNARLADVLAITSPRVSVKRNLRFAIHYVTTGEYPHDMMQGVRAALQHYEATHEIRGPKTEPFARATLGDDTAIVLDVWMAKAFGIDQREFSVKPVHAECCKRIAQAAKRLGWAPAEVQAAIWTAVVRQHGRTPAAFDLVHSTLFGEFVQNAA